ncbi:MAG TPA: ATPase, partial [Cytophagales bacterium]|nr:ATPase [Cytophagales bacterium]
VLGGLGFGALNALFSPARLRQRLQKPWIDWQPSTKIAVFTSAVLLLLGTLWFLALENNSALTGQGWLDKLVTSFFQSATTRTAGFNTVDIGSLTLPVLLVMIILMFIGASSGSVGGGIKTSTFFIIFASVWQLIKGRRGVYINKRFLANDLYFKAMAIFAFAIAYNIIAFVILAVIHPDIKAISLLFEQVSAFGTVGLSMGITTSLSGGAKFLIISSMFLGRVGILTFAYSISGKQQSRNFKYPVTRIMVG